MKNFFKSKLNIFLLLFLLIPCGVLVFIIINVYWENYFNSELKKYPYVYERCKSARGKLGKPACYEAAAREVGKEGDLAKCDETLGGFAVSECYNIVAQIKNDYSICEKIRGRELKDSCYSGIARSTKNASLCEKLSSEEWKKPCCYSVVGKNGESGDISFCDKKYESAKYCREVCYRNVATALKDISICDNLQFFQDSCHSSLSRAKNDSSLCGLMKDGESRDTCYHLSIFDITPDLEVCSKIMDYSRRGWCYRDMASIKKDITICDDYGEDQNQIDECYRNVAESALDERICERLSTDAKKDNCFQGVALKANDASVCDKISREMARGLCHKNVETKTKIEAGNR